ncbi:MAG: hypothetical protein BWK77_08455, partial [Verrucomicrobia bacterium A1]
TPYEIRSMLPLVNLGQKQRAKALLDNVLSFMRPRAWNHLPEVVHSDPRLGRYIGDMPHTWVGSGYINSVRGMLIEEEGDVLHLLPGVPAEWVESGTGIFVENAPTHFGMLNLRARVEANVLTVDIGGTANAPGAIRLHWPREGKPSRVTVDGKDWTDYTEDGCPLPCETKQVVAAW